MLVTAWAVLSAMKSDPVSAKELAVTLVAELDLAWGQEWAAMLEEGLDPVLVRVSAVLLATDLDPVSAKEWAVTLVRELGLALVQEWAAMLEVG